MQSQTFPNREVSYDRRVSVAPRGCVVVPPHHTQNLRSVFGTTSVKPRVTTAIDGISRPLSTVKKVVVATPAATKLRPAVINVDELINEKPVKPVANSIEKVIVNPKPEVMKQTVTSVNLGTVNKKDHSAILAAKKAETEENRKKQRAEIIAKKKALADKRQTDKENLKLKKAELKKEKAAEKTAKHAAKQLKRGITKTSKTAKRGHENAQNSGNTGHFTSQVLASAASTMPTSRIGGGAVRLDNAGAGAIPNDGRVSHVVQFPNVAIEFDINRRRIANTFKGLIVVAVIGASGFLAWDTWVNNRNVNGAFSNASASAVSLDSSNPMSVDPASISNQAWNSYVVPAEQPRYLYMDSIGVKARVISVGINSDGNINSPSNANDTGWYDGSAKPGNDGQVFINGHTSFSSAFQAAFDKLPELRAGSIITIERGDGQKINYKVISNKTVSTDEVDMKTALNVPDGADQGLTIMTYTGDYNYRTKTADKRVVVYAVRQ